MEEFSITCTTCGSRLKVRDESLVGQILSCPKCSAMVMIQAPDEQLAIGRDTVDSQAITKDSIASSGIVDPDSELGGQPTRPIVAFETPHDDSEPPASLPPDWQAAQAGSARQFGLIAIVAIIALVTAIGLFGLFVQSSMNDEQVADAEPNEVAALPVEATVVTETEQVDEENLAIPPPNTEIDESEREIFPEEQVADPVIPIESPVPTIDVGAETPASMTDINSIFPEVGNNRQEEAASFDTLMQDALNPFGDLLGEGIGGPPIDLKALQTKRKQAITFDLPRTPKRIYPPAAQAVGIQERLNQRLPGIDFSDRSLAAIVSVISELSGIPLTIDLQSLDSAGISAGQKFTSRYLDTTVGGALEKILQSAKCRTELTAAGQMSVRATEEATEEFIRQALKIDDFKDPDFLTRVQQVCISTEDPVEFEADALTGDVKVKGSQAARWRAVLAIEAFRISNGLPTRLPRGFTGRWLRQSVPEEFPVPAADKISIEGDQPRPVAFWITKAAESLDANVLIDWPSAWANGLTTQHTILPWVRDVSLTSLTQEALEPFGLVLRDVGDNTWVVATPIGFESTDLIVAFPAVIKGDHDEFLDELAESAGYGQRDVMPAAIDPESGRLICRMPLYALIQIPQLFEKE